MAHETKQTTNHEAIRSWVSARDGRPAKVRGIDGKQEGILRIDFPGGAGEEELEHISWEDFFDIFETHKLVFLYQEQLKSGEESRFFKFIDRE